MNQFYPFFVVKNLNQTAGTLHSGLGCIRLRPPATGLALDQTRSKDPADPTNQARKICRL